MRVFSVLAYLAGFILFVVLCATEANNFITETSIKDSDETGEGGQTCQMISKVSATYSVEAGVEPMQNYYMVNVMESSSQAASDLSEASQCANTQFSAGVTTEYSPTMGEMAYAPDGSLYFLSVTPEVVTSIASDGVLSTYGMPPGGSNYDNVAVGPSGALYFAGYEYVSETSGGSWEMVQDLPKSSKIVQDNFNNLYYIDGCSFYSITVTNLVATTNLVFAISSSCTGIGSFGIFNPGTNAASIQYYFEKNDNTASTITTYVMYEDGVYTTLPQFTIPNSNGYPSMAVDGSGNVYQVGDGLTMYNVDSGVTTTLVASVPYTSATSINPSFTSLAINSGGQIYVYDIASGTGGILGEQTGFSVDWFTCGNSALATVPASSASYGTTCPLNGLVGSTVFQDTYYFATTGMQTYAEVTAAPLCNAYTAPVLATVGDLPPYSCTVKIYPGFFDVLGVAVANTEFLLLLLVMCFATVLEKFASTSSSAGADVKKGADAPDVEMTGNPLTQTVVTNERVALLEEDNKQLKEQNKLADERIDRLEAAMDNKKDKK